mmetsp:Transcript_32648/g.59857  ORF Transcript_32648/g.59857 Transcript_32648/m.59857 type:complete len:150 (+) Transcript_32648:1181-1630(+)
MERYELRAFPRRGQCDRRLPNDPQPNSDRRGRAPVDHCQRLWNCPFTEGVKSPPWFPCFTVRQMRSMMPVQMPFPRQKRFQSWSSNFGPASVFCPCVILNAESITPAPVGVHAVAERPFLIWCNGGKTRGGGKERLPAPSLLLLRDNFK